MVDEFRGLIRALEFWKTGAAAGRTAESGNTDIGESADCRPLVNNGIQRRTAIAGNKRLCKAAESEAKLVDYSRGSHPGFGRSQSVIPRIRRRAPLCLLDRRTVDGEPVVISSEEAGGQSVLVIQMPIEFGKAVVDAEGAVEIHHAARRGTVPEYR